MIDVKWSKNAYGATVGTRSSGTGMIWKHAEGISEMVDGINQLQYLQLFVFDWE